MSMVDSWWLRKWQLSYASVPIFYAGKVYDLWTMSMYDFEVFCEGRSHIFMHTETWKYEVELCEGIFAHNIGSVMKVEFSL